MVNARANLEQAFTYKYKLRDAMSPRERLLPEMKRPDQRFPPFSCSGNLDARVAGEEASPLRAIDKPPMLSRFHPVSSRGGCVSPYEARAIRHMTLYRGSARCDSRRTVRAPFTRFFAWDYDGGLINFHAPEKVEPTAWTDFPRVCLERLSSHDYPQRLWNRGSRIRRTANRFQPPESS